jgi:hypothetical protein
MKKILLVAAFAIYGLGTVNAQGFSYGVNIGFPVGDAKAMSSFSYGLDVLYMFNADEDFTYGVTTGYQNYVGKTITFLGIDLAVPDANFIPLAFAGRYAVSDQFSLGADVGYGISDNGGFYYRPMVVYSLSDVMKINASYSGLSVSGGTVSNVGVGLMYAF